MAAASMMVVALFMVSPSVKNTQRLTCKVKRLGWFLRWVRFVLQVEIQNTVHSWGWNCPLLGLTMPDLVGGVNTFFVPPSPRT